MKKEELHRFICDSKGNESNITQICVMKDGKFIYEDSWRGFTGDDAANVNSVTKGIMALLAGIALDQGSIRSLDQKVMDFFPDYSPKRGETTIYDVTIRHLLTMTAPYKGKSEPWKKVCTSKDWTLAILDSLGGRKGITGEFRYATLGIQILAGIIERSCREKSIDFANRNLFVPLGLPERIPHGDSSKEDQFDFLMNNSNIILAAKQTQSVMSDKNIFVMETKSVQAGLSAVGMFDKQGKIEDVITDLQDVIDNVDASSVTYAIKDTVFEGVEVKEGDFIAIANKGIVASGKSRKEVVFALLDQLFKNDEKELITVITGEDRDDAEVKEVEDYIAEHSDLECEIIDGGQPVYSYLIGLE